MAEEKETKPAAPVKSGGSSKAVIVIVIVIVVLAALGVGVWLGWKYIKNKIAGNAGTVATNLATKTTPKKMQDLIELFKYPGATITKMDAQTTNNESTAEMAQTTSDDTKSVYNYYEGMIAFNLWKEGSKGFTTGAGGWLTVEEADFNATLNISWQDNKSVIEITLYSSNNDVTSSRKKPTLDSSQPVPTTSEESAVERTGTIPSGGYVISDSDSRLISESELTSLTPWQLKVARNEIYARHGREFVHKDLQCYFAQQNWYSIDPNFSESMLSTVENKNVATILNYEKVTNSPLLQVDSGC